MEDNDTINLAVIKPCCRVEQIRLGKTYKMRRSEKWGKKSSQNIIFFKKAFFGLFLNFY